MTIMTADLRVGLIDALREDVTIYEGERRRALAYLALVPDGAHLPDADADDATDPGRVANMLDFYGVEGDGKLADLESVVHDLLAADDVIETIDELADGSLRVEYDGAAFVVSVRRE